MVKKVKDKWLGARVDKDVYAAVETYTEAAELNMGDLLRAAVDEYILNHPIKTPREPALEQLKPGGKE